MKANPELKRLEKLTGRWKLSGHTLDSMTENIKGWNTFEWISDGFFIESKGEIDFKGMKVQSVEIIGYDPSTDDFPSTVYSSMSESPIPYRWDVRGNKVVHSGAGAIYIGTLSDDGDTLTGGWRPEEGMKNTEGRSYDAVMTRMK
jgi:hypothetical protein